jgi:plasmid stabilization system protein ParE
MGLKVVWSRRAEKNYTQILDYIVNRFGEASGRKYFERVQNLVSLLRQHPELGTHQMSEKGIYAIVLFRRTTIFYVFSDTELRIINVVDNRWKK